METITLWEILTLISIVLWLFISTSLNVTHRIRCITRPIITLDVLTNTSFILGVQSFRNVFLDALFSGLSFVVSVPFYTAFLPLLFWSGHDRLGRQMTLLLAFCVYFGNSLKDLISAPRPCSPPVSRVTSTKEEEENALEYGFPSSHTLNTVCLSGYLLHYILVNSQVLDDVIVLSCLGLVCSLVLLIGLGRIYLGMHSLIDVLSGVFIGLIILVLWSLVDDHIDNFIIEGKNVTFFWAVLSLVFLFAYPSPENPTPSYTYHTAFNGVALGIVCGVNHSCFQFPHQGIATIFGEKSPPLTLMGRTLVGIPIILIVKFCSKELAKWVLPMICNTLGMEICSSGYASVPNISIRNKRMPDYERSRYISKWLFFGQTIFDVDTGIRFLQYAGLGWSVVDLVPSIFLHLGL